MLVVRSLLFGAVFYTVLIGYLLITWPAYFLPRRLAWRVVISWARVSLWLQRIIVGTKVSYRGLENLPAGGYLVASKHQAMWETFALIPCFPYATFVLKKELMKIPIFGWAMKRMGMIAVDREAGRKALVGMAADSRAAVARGEQVIIFPEGTRQVPGAAPDYKPGIALLYRDLGVPCVPVALNSGLYWPRRTHLRHPGTIVVEFLPAIPPGLPRADFMARLEADIETASHRLVAEAAASRNPPPIPLVARNDIQAKL